VPGGDDPELTVPTLYGPSFMLKAYLHPVEFGVELPVVLDDVDGQNVESLALPPKRCRALD
jgi:hypothetical protein